MDYKITELTREENGLAVLTINSPENMNAMTQLLGDELLSRFCEIEHDDSVRTLCITGSGKAFIAGGDLALMGRMTQDEMREYSMLWYRAFDMLWRSSKCVIAAINGYALGGGCELALSCDFRYASDRVKIGFPEVTLGKIPGAGGTQRAPRTIGLSNAKELILTGKRIDAATAKEMGLVDKVVSGEALMDAVRETAALIAKTAPLAFASAKKALHLSMEEPMTSSLLREIDIDMDLFVTEDAKEGVKAFLEKRSPEYKGK